MAYTREQYEEAVAIYERAVVAAGNARKASVRCQRQLDIAEKGLRGLESRSGVPLWMVENAPAGGWTAETYAAAK
jgi:hypothetical protein